MTFSLSHDTRCVHCSGKTPLSKYIFKTVPFATQRPNTCLKQHCLMFLYRPTFIFVSGPRPLPHRCLPTPKVTTVTLQGSSRRHDVHPTTFPDQSVPNGDWYETAIQDSAGERIQD